ncbi:MAG TPA: hypothetical protein VGP39_23635 [Bradyrhizobium sp.]|nr:hypothetical protein [Bradyrhizobium sp.]
MPISGANDALAPAKLGVSTPAGVTVSAMREGRRTHAFAGSDRGNCFADLADYSRKLMAKDNRRLLERVLSQVDRHIGSAQAGHLDLDQYVLGPKRRQLKRDHPNTANVGQHGGFCLHDSPKGSQSVATQFTMQPEIANYQI